MLEALILYSTKADRFRGQPSLNLKHVITMKEAVIYTVVQHASVKRKRKDVENISEQKFEKLIAKEFVGYNNENRQIWKCLCDCGMECFALATLLKRRLKRSCGCLMGTPTHGMSRNPATRDVYKIHEKIIQRCTNPNCDSYKDYGGRGIGIAPEWDHPSKFAAFYEHIGPRPTPKHCVERPNNDGNYEPGNVVWATRAVEMRNTRRTVRITFRGETLCRKDMAEKYGMKWWTLKKRLQLGWSIEDALTIPVMSRWEHERLKTR